MKGLGWSLVPDEASDDESLFTVTLPSTVRVTRRVGVNDLNDLPGLAQRIAEQAIEATPWMSMPRDSSGCHLPSTPI